MACLALEHTGFQVRIALFALNVKLCYEAKACLLCPEAASAHKNLCHAGWRPAWRQICSLRLSALRQPRARSIQKVVSYLSLVLR